LRDAQLDLGLRRIRSASRKRLTALFKWSQPESSNCSFYSLDRFDNLILFSSDIQHPDEPFDFFGFGWQQ
jgi:hypothetical protein